MQQISTLNYRLVYSGASYVDGTLVSSVPRTVLSAYSATNSRTGTGLKGWKAKIRANESATTPFNAQETYVVSRPAVINTVWMDDFGPYAKRVRRIEVRGDVFKAVTPDASSISVAAAQAKAYADFKEQINNLERSVEGLAFIGEIRETLKMLRSPLRALRQAVGYYLPTLQKKLKRAKRKQWRAVIGSTWLEWRFGVRPLVMDIDGAINALAKIGEWSPAFVMTAFGKTVTSSMSLSRVTDPAYNRHTFDMASKTVDEALVRYKVGIKARYFPESGAPSLLKGLGIEFERFVPSLYEVMPYSWLIDYFTNVSDVLLSKWVDQSQVAWVNQTVRKKRSIYTAGKLDVKATKALYSSPPVFSCDADCGYQLASHKVVSRSALSEVPVPPIVLWAPPASSLRWLNIAGLVAQQRAWTIFRTH